jgi:hypothetical protein
LALDQSTCIKRMDCSRHCPRTSRTSYIGDQATFIASGQPTFIAPVQATLIALENRHSMSPSKPGRCV